MTVEAAVSFVPHSMDSLAKRVIVNRSTERLASPTTHYRPIIAQSSDSGLSGAGRRGSFCEFELEYWWRTCSWCSS